jgi:cytochrome c556
MVCADDQDVVDYRQHIMKTLGEQVAAMGMILEHRAATDSFATHAEILAIAAATAKSAFEVRVVGGGAKPDVWVQWSDFAKQLDALAAATDDLARSAKEGGIPAAGPKFQALNCTGCHDKYAILKP